MNKKLEFSSLILLLQIMTPTNSLHNGLALRPPMGWMSWERYRCITDCENYPEECISETLYRKVADILVDEGYKNKGYEYVIIDDCWLSKSRDENGNLQPDPERFPSGIKNLSDYIHSKGLKFGMYEDYGTKTCEGYPGMIDYLKQDSNKFAEWEVDYLKVDGCNADTRKMDKGYPELGRYLNETGRPIVYSCSWPAYQEGEDMSPDYASIAKHCNLWRNYDDIQDSYYSLMNIIDHFASQQEVYIPNAGPGHWNDPDMLIIGNFGLSYEQSKLQMAIWAILAAPLLMSTDLNSIRPEYKDILQNEDIIAVNQDPLGIQGRRIFKKLGIQVWTRPITPVYQTYYSYAIAFVSRRQDGVPYPFNVTLQDLGLYYPGGYKITDLFKEDPALVRVYKPESIIKFRVKPTGVVFIRADINN
ncbi:alpha-N-acetylgalactosaminidase-like [Lycorma delicatula]|uniref:alpha-N-acetylgalactosaminidase-like n=1 Tax=Lycorma delicatula TaxID=130591 RepID=UPI003F510890